MPVNETKRKVCPGNAQLNYSPLAGRYVCTYVGGHTPPLNLHRFTTHNHIVSPLRCSKSLTWRICASASLHRLGALNLSRGASPSLQHLGTASLSRSASPSLQHLSTASLSRGVSPSLRHLSTVSLSRGVSPSLRHLSTASLSRGASP